MASERDRETERDLLTAAMLLLPVLLNLNSTYVFVPPEFCGAR